MQRRSETWGGVYVGDPTTGNIEALPLPKPALVRQFRAMRERRARALPIRVSLPAPRQRPRERRERRTGRTTSSRGDPGPESDPHRAHRLDGELAAALWHRRRALRRAERAFPLPPSLREAK